MNLPQGIKSCIYVHKVFFQYLEGGDVEYLWL